MPSQSEFARESTEEHALLESGYSLYNRSLPTTSSKPAPVEPAKNQPISSQGTILQRVDQVSETNDMHARTHSGDPKSGNLVFKSALISQIYDNNMIRSGREGQSIGVEDYPSLINQIASAGKLAIQHCKPTVKSALSVFCRPVKYAV